MIVRKWALASLTIVLLLGVLASVVKYAARAHSQKMAPPLSAQALFLLGNAYRSGNGVPRDERRALELYERAGARGNAAALQTLALAYRYGELGLEPDDAVARHYQAEADHAAQEPHAP
jgi:TPR repeat protein